MGSADVFEAPCVARWIASARSSLLARCFLATPTNEREPFRYQLKALLARAIWNGGTDVRLSEYSSEATNALLQAGLDRNRAGRLIYERAVEIERQRAEGLADWRRLDHQARRIAYLLLYSTCEARSITSVGKNFFGKSWKSYWRDHDPSVLDELAIVLHDPRADTFAKIAAIAATETIGSGPGATLAGNHCRPWRRVQQHLLDHVVGWPLLVLKQPDGTPIGCSLPVILDLRTDQHSQVEVISSDDSMLSITEWKGMMHTARRRAWMLWRPKHGNYGQAREYVRDLRVHVDLRVAAAVLEPTRNTAITALDIDGSSAVPYFTQLILSRFLGKSAMSATAITAVEQRPIEIDGRTVDYVLQVPGDVEQKLRRARESTVFTRVVVARAETQDEDEALNVARLIDPEWEAHVELRAAQTHSDISDIVQLHGWRQYKYVRAPELRWGLHSTIIGRPGVRHPTTNNAVARVLAQLVEHDGGVVLTDEGGSAVASALWHITSRLRVSWFGKRAPAGLSWVFVRTTGLADEDLWTLVWEAIGANREDLARLFAADTAEDAAVIVATALSRFDPVDGAAHTRAPDLLVLLTPRGADQDEVEAGQRPLAIGPVISELAQTPHLRRIPDIRYERLLGATRVIVAADRVPLVSSAGRQSKRLMATDRPLDDVAAALSIFESGVDAITASRYLEAIGIPRDDFRECLAEAKESGRKGAIRWGQGEFHVALEAVQYLPLLDDVKMSQRHFAAAMALAPILEQQDLSSYGLDRGLTSERLIAAHYQLQRMFEVLRGFEIRGHTTIDAILESAKIASSWLITMMLPRSWATVYRASRHGGLQEFAYESARLMMRETRQPGAKRLITASVAAFECAKWAYRSTAKPALSNEALAAALRWGRAALERARAAADSDALFVTVGTIYSSMLRERPDSDGTSGSDGTDEADESDCQIIAAGLRALQANPGVDLEIGRRWLLAKGNAIADDRASIVMYRDVLMLTEDEDLRIQALGAAVRAKDADAIGHFVQLLKGTNAEMIRKSRHRFANRTRQAGKKESIAMKRWIVGLQFLEADSRES